MSVVAGQMARIALLVLLGCLLAKIRLVDEEAQKFISKLVLNVTNPALTLTSVVQTKLDSPHAEILRAAGISLLIYALMMVVGVILPKVLRVEKMNQKYYNMMSVYTNVGFIGIPVARALLDDTSMLAVIIFNVLFTLFFYTHGHIVMGVKRESGGSGIFSVGTVCGILAIVIAWFGITVPGIAADVIVYVGNANTFLAMTILGATLAASSIKEIFAEKQLYPFMIIRMLLIPIVTAKILTFAGADRALVLAMALMMSMPAGNLPLLLAEARGEKATTLSHGILFTTIFSFIGITIVMSVV